MNTQELTDRLNSALEADDFETIAKLKDAFVEASQAQRPFEPALRLRHEEGEEGEFEGDQILSIANSISRAFRKRRYDRRRSGGYSGPIIVSEGDSWFQYPFILEDIIDNLSEIYAVYSLGAGGDTLANMLAVSEFAKAIEREEADFFLFSASGNDIVGDGNLAELLNDYEPGMEVPHVINGPVFTQTVSKIEAGFVQVIETALAIRPGLHIMFHGYDWSLPRRNGQWLGPQLQRKGIPSTMWPGVIGYLIDALNETLVQFETRFPGRATHVDCRGQVGSTIQSWHDELHPRNAGYRRVASLFGAQIERIWQERRPRSAAVEAMSKATVASAREVWTPGDEYIARIGAEEEALIDTNRDVDGLGRNQPQTKTLSKLDQEILADYQELLREETEPDQDKRLRARRHMVPEDDEKAFERILGISNLFPINYLSRGAQKARAVAKIQLFYRGEIPAGSGSGFLVAPGLLLTNNHVIGRRETARRSKAIFDFEQDDRFEHKATKTFDITDDVFFTSDRHKLDFTFVSVRPINERDDDLSQFGHFTLIEESGKAIRKEPVSIVQHPNGGLKNIALRDSQILGVKGDFIYYSTDTEPGSSGAPVLNDQWLPVALHHRSVPHPTIENKWIANRGIRVSRIFVTLKEAAAQGDADARRILELLGVGPEEQPAIVVSPHRPLRPGEAGFVTPTDGPAPGVAVSAIEEASFPADRWDGIDGYDPDFLQQNLPLPLPNGGADVREVNGRPDLPYLHFSVVMHDTRKLPMLTACNLDGARLKRLTRSGSWRTDPRLPENSQIDNRAYRHNDYDRGHLVRRIAPMWGTTGEARFAEADTFHYTNAAPQHARLNQRAWLELEDYLLDWAEDNRTRMSIFTGPVFRPDDPVYRGIVKVPADYWKVAIGEGATGLRAVGYLHTQKNLIPSVEEAFGDYKTHRVPIHVLADLTSLDMGPLIAHDVSSEPFEAIAAVALVEGREDTGFFS